MKTFCRLTQWLLIGLVSLSLAVACGSSTQLDPSTTPASPPASPEETRVIQHVMGETQVPLQPQRVAVLHDLILDPVMALGIKPVAIATYMSEEDMAIRAIPPDQLQGIDRVGAVDQPNLEKLLLLKPDLILAHESLREFYPQLTAIAPTVLVSREQIHPFDLHLNYVAQVLRKEDTAQDVLDRYQARIDTLRQEMGDRLQTLRISVVDLFWDGQLSSPGSAGFASYIFKDIGLQRSPIQEQWLAEHADPMTFSLEALEQHDADVLFFVEYSDRDAELALKNPLWQQLKVVQTGRLYEVEGDIWGGAGPIAANRLLDDLFQYLVDD